MGKFTTTSETKNLIIDADSIVYKIYHRDKDVSVEMMYWKIIENIIKVEKDYNRALWQTQQMSVHFDSTLILSPAKYFRHDLSSLYKAGRPPQPEKITLLKQMLFERLPEKVVAIENIEADDVFTYMVNNTGAYNAAIDKDVLYSTTYPTFNYNTKKIVELWDKPNVEQWYIFQSMLGDRIDGIKGAKGIGKGTASKIAYDEIDKLTYNGWASLFKSEEEAILNMRLVRMDQWTPDKGLILWTPDLWQYSW